MTVGKRDARRPVFSLPERDVPHSSFFTNR